MKGHGHILHFLLAFALLLGRAEAEDLPKSTALVADSAALAKVEIIALVAELDRGTPGAVAAAIKRFSEVAPPSLGADESSATRLFVAACGAASESELEALREILLTQFESNSTAAYELSAYTQARLRVNVAKANSAGRKITLPPPTVPVPEFAATDPELRQAWIAWHTAIDPYNAMIDKANAANRAAKAQAPAKVEDTLRKMLREPKADLVEEIALHLQSEFVMLNQREMVLFPASRAVLLATMRDQLTPETLGASFYLIPGRQVIDSGPKPGAMRESICALLAVAGLDWEEVFAGGMIQDAGAPPARRIPLVLDDMSSWQALAARGSPRGIRLGLSIIRKTKLDAVRSIDFIRTALRTTAVEPLTQNDRIRNVRPLPFRAEELPADVREEVLSTLQDFLSLERTPAELTQTLRLLPRELQATMAEPLRKLLHHPSYPIATQARAMLVNAKLAEPDAEITAPPPPLRVRVMVDDAPLATARLRVSTGLRTTSLSTDADGWVKVPLDQELDLSKVRNVTLSSELSEVTNQAGEWPGPWIETSVPVDGKVDQEFTATSTTTSLEVDIDPTSEFQLTKPARIILTRNREIPWRQQDRLSLPVTEAVTFQHLQRGTYHFEVQAEGAARYQSKPVVLGKNGSIRLVRLEPGRDVRVKIQTSDSIMHLSRARLFRNGEAYPVAINNNYTGWEGLPLGKYELRMDPWPGKLQGLMLGFENVPKNGYEGLTHAFELKADSPPVVDLGTLPLKAKE